MQTKLLRFVALAALLQLSSAQFYCSFPSEPISPEPECRGGESRAFCVDFKDGACNKGTRPEASSNETGSSFILTCDSLTSFTMFFYKDSWECDGSASSEVSYSTEACVAIGAGVENTNRLGFFVTCNSTSAAACLSSDSTTNRLDLPSNMETSVQLKDLAVGDLVESYDLQAGQKVFSEVFLIQHQHQDNKVPVRRVSYITAQGEEAALRATDRHYLYGPDGKIAVSDLVEGSAISVLARDTQDMVSARVTSVDRVFEPIRNIHTMNDKLVVDGVLVSSFARLDVLGFNVGQMPFLMSPLKALYRMRMYSVIDAADRWMSLLNKALSGSSKTHSLPL